MQLKRLWDTDHVRMVCTEWPSGHMCQVWTDETGTNLYIYDMAQWLTYDAVSKPGETYNNSWWVQLTDEVVWFYDSSEPTDVYSRDNGDKAYYQFVDWDGTVLKSWTVEEGETPTPPADPTRSPTQQYYYTFAWWNPTVWPISKRTTYTATYTASVNVYSISIASNNPAYWTVDESSVEVPYGTALSVSGNTLTIGTGEDAVVVTATANSNCEFSSWWVWGWWEVPATVTGILIIVATFTANVSIEINDSLSDTTGTVGETVTVYFTKAWASGLLYSDEPDILTVASSDDTGWEGYTNSVTLTVNSAGTTTLTITADAGWGVTASDTIEIVCSAPEEPYEIQNVAYYEYEEFGEEGSKTWSEKLYLFANNNSSSNCICIDTAEGTVTAMWAFADSKFDYELNWDTVNRREHIFEQLLADDIVEQMVTDIADYTTGEQHDVVKFANNNNEYTYMAGLFNATTAMNSRQNYVISAFNTAHENRDVILELYNS